MANTTIPQLPAVAAVTGDAQIAAVQNGITVRITAQQIANISPQTSLLTLANATALDGTEYVPGLQGGSGFDPWANVKITSKQFANYTVSNSYISSLPAATSLTGTEKLSGVQVSTSSRITAKQIADYSISNISSLTAASSLTGSEQIGALQSSSAVRVTTQQIANLVQIGIAPSGDTTGATDTTAFNNALNAARIAGGGVVTGQTGSTFYTNNSLVIGTNTTLILTGCTVNLVVSSNCPMIVNYSQLHPVATGNFVCESGTKFFTASSNAGGSNALMNYIYNWGSTLALAPAYDAPALTFTIPMAFGSVSQAVFVANVMPYPQNYGFSVDRQTVSGIGSYTAANLYLRDYRISIVGGIWNRGTNGAGGIGENNHLARFRWVDGLFVESTTMLSQGSNGLYAVLLTGVTNVFFRNMGFEKNPGLYPINYGNVGYQRDGIHITGPSSHIKIENTNGSLGDDTIAITTLDWVGQTGDYGGDVTDCEFVGLHSSTGAVALKLMAGPSTTLARVRARDLTGWAVGSGGGLWIGDDNRQAGTVGGTIDQIEIDGINILQVPPYVSPQTTAYPYIYLAGAGLGRIRLKGIGFNLPSGITDTANGVIEIGTQLAGLPSAQTTSITELVINDFFIGSIGASQKVIYAGSNTTITSLKTSNWSTPVTNFPLVSIAGTVTNWDMKDKLSLVSLTARTASISTTTAITTPTGGAGLYRVIVDMVVTTAGTAGTVTATITTNNGSASFAQTSSTLSLTTLGNELSVSFTARCGSATNIQYATTVSGATGSPQYSLNIRAEYLG